MKIEIKDYVKKLGGNTVLDHVSLELTGGKVYGLKGKNGSGKTMLLRAICGLIRPTKGLVELDGRVLGKDMTFPESLGILLENPGFIPEYTGMENLKILAELRDVVKEEQIAAVMRKVGLDPDEKKKYRKYSLGMKQKLGIAAAIMEKPALILLDEPTNALDVESVERFRDIVRELRNEDRILVIASHDMQELDACCDEVFQMENGRIRF